MLDVDVILQGGRGRLLFPRICKGKCTVLGNIANFLITMCKPSLPSLHSLVQ